MLNYIRLLLPVGRSRRYPSPCLKPGACRASRSLWVSAAAPVELSNQPTEDEVQSVIRAVYRQVLGNQHVMDSQRLTSAESLLRNGDVTVRGFVRLVAQSGLYQTLFFENSNPYRFVELNCKHLLGRAPRDQAEIFEHTQRYNVSGYNVDIDSYVDSAEYLANFGENRVPYAIATQTQTGNKNVDFNRAFALDRGYASHNTAGAKLIGDLAGNLGTIIRSPRSGNGVVASTSKSFRITTSKVTFAVRTRRSNQVFTVGYSQLSAQIKSIQKAGGKILSIAEA